MEDSEEALDFCRPLLRLHNDELRMNSAQPQTLSLTMNGLCTLAGTGFTPDSWYCLNQTWNSKVSLLDHSLVFEYARSATAISSTERFGPGKYRLTADNNSHRLGQQFT
ncbi:MAG TPA: hypothetical protein VMX56_04065 [Anaerolineales bacterium]|nr:hypothetical protein [Anaerolineales bacterium]